MAKKSDYPEVSTKMDKTVSVYEEDLKGYRVGRANPSVLDKLTVDYYGTATPIPQIGSVSVPDARTLMIQPWDISLLKEVEKAITNSELGLTPSNDGKVIRLNFPPLTEDRRRDLAKKLSKRSEDAKVAIRAIRRDAVESYKKKKKDSEITEDDLKDIEKGIQALTDEYVKEIDQIFATKEKEIMNV